MTVATFPTGQMLVNEHGLCIATHQIIAASNGLHMDMKEEALAKKLAKNGDFPGYMEMLAEDVVFAQFI